MLQITNETKGSLYSIISGLFYGMVGYFGITIINSNLSIANMLFWRFLISSIALSLTLLCIPSGYRLNRRDLLVTMAFGALFYTGSSATYFAASKYIGTGLAMVILFSYPAFVLLYQLIFTKHKVSTIYYCSITLIVLGMGLLLSREEVEFELIGTLYGIASAACYATYILSTKQQIADLPPLVSGLMVSIGNCIICLCFSLYEQSFTIPSSYQLWINIISIGIICTSLPMIFLIKGLQYIKAEKASILSALEPVCVILIGVIVLEEKLSLLQAISCIIILSGALIVQFDKKETS